MPINLYHTQRIRGFQQLKENYSPKSLTVKLKRTKFNCRKCGSEHLTTTAIRQREVRGQPMGECRKVVFVFTIHRIYCKDCKYRSIENIHFHVIKLMNEKVDKVRRRMVSKMGEVQKKELKGLRFVFLKNYEHLEEDGKSILRNMRGDYQDLGDVYMFKESLRQIYICRQKHHITQEELLLVGVRLRIKLKFLN